jgi:hypothetical protein
MSKLLKSLLNQAKKVELGHAIHENCVITEVSVKGKPDKDNKASKWNCLTKFTKMDDKGAVIGEKEVSWYDLDFTNEHVSGRFTTQITQIVNILECYITPEEVNALLDPILADFDITDEESRDAILKDKDNCTNLMDDIAKAYVKEMVNHLNGAPVRLKLTFDNKGKYVSAPMFNDFVEPMTTPLAESKLKFSKNEIENEAKSHNVIVPASNKNLSVI